MAVDPSDVETFEAVNGFVRRLSGLEIVGRIWVKAAVHPFVSTKLVLHLKSEKCFPAYPEKLS
jgi:hypothetical protein